MEATRKILLMAGLLTLLTGPVLGCPDPNVVPPWPLKCPAGTMIVWVLTDTRTRSVCVSSRFQDLSLAERLETVEAMRAEIGRCDRLAAALPRHTDGTPR